MPWVSSDAWGFLSFKERKKPREIPGGKKKRRSYAAKRIILFFLVILDVLTMCYNNMYIEEKQ